MSDGLREALTAAYLPLFSEMSTTAVVEIAMFVIEAHMERVEIDLRVGTGYTGAPWLEIEGATSGFVDHEPDHVEFTMLKGSASWEAS